MIGPSFSPLVVLCLARVKNLGSGAGFLTFVRAAAARVKKPAFDPPPPYPAAVDVRQTRWAVYGNSNSFCDDGRSSDTSTRASRTPPEEALSV